MEWEEESKGTNRSGAQIDKAPSLFCNAEPRGQGGPSTRGRANVTRSAVRLQGPSDLKNESTRRANVLRS